MNEYFSITAANGFHDLLKEQFPHPLQRAIMPIIMDRGGRPEVVGTAFAIGHRIALTAAHTFVTDGEQQGDALRLLYIYGEGVGGELHGGELPVERFTYANDTDLAIMRFKMPILVETNEELTHLSLQLSFGGPHIGDECHAIAYAPEFAVKEGAPVPTFTLNPHLQFAPGEILDIYPGGRGALLPGPGFLTDAQFDGGMSGGPILVPDTVPGFPRVIGIVAAGRERLDEIPSSFWHSLRPPF